MTSDCAFLLYAAGLVCIVTAIFQASVGCYLALATALCCLLVVAAAYVYINERG